MQHTNIKHTLFTLVFALAAAAAFAQIPPSGVPGGSPQAVPVDGGAVALLMAAGGYGYQKLRRKKKKESSEQTH